MTKHRVCALCGYLIPSGEAAIKSTATQKFYCAPKQRDECEKRQKEKAVGH